MGGVRIKDLQSAEGLLAGHFDDMFFVVDLAEVGATLRVSGRELREAVGLREHRHTIADVQALEGELEKRLKRSGGTITGDLRIEGSARVKSLSVDEFLEVPEIKHNRVTATGNEMWITDCGTVEDAWAEDGGLYMVVLKGEDGVPTVRFESQDILRGVTNLGGDTITFATAFYRVTQVVDERSFYCEPLNDVPPQRFMTLARQGNVTDANRQGSIYLDGLNQWLRVLDGVSSEDIDQDNIKIQLGDLSNLMHPIFGHLSGYGALLENAYICGRLVQRDPTTGEDWAVGAVSVQGEQCFKYDDEGRPDKESITLTATERGFSSTAEERKWQQLDGDSWSDIPDTQSLTYTLHHDADIWRSRNSITLRYIAQSSYFDTITISKLYDGTSLYTVIVRSSNGDNFLNGNITTTLTAHLFKGSEELTATLPSEAFSWVRISSNTLSDKFWNAAHEDVGDTIYIGSSDLTANATFRCNITI